MMKGWWVVPTDLLCCGGWLVHVAVVGYQLKHSILENQKTLAHRNVNQQLWCGFVALHCSS